MQGLELQGIAAVARGALQALTTSLHELPPQVTQLLATCHGLAQLGQELVGDPLDQRLFLATGGGGRGAGRRQGRGGQ